MDIKSTCRDKISRQVSKSMALRSFRSFKTWVQVKAATKMASEVSKSTNENDVDDNFEILELAEAGKNWLERALDGELSKKSVPVQIAMGGTSGWVAGYLFQKVSKAAATAVGGGFLLILVGHQTGYLKVNWKQFEKDISKSQEKAVQEVEKRYPAIQGAFNKTKELAKKNVMISSGFAAGFLLGMAM